MSFHANFNWHINFSNVSTDNRPRQVHDWRQYHVQLSFIGCLTKKILIYGRKRYSYQVSVLRSPPWLGWPVWKICITNDHGYVLLVVSTSWSFPRSWLIIRFVTKLTRGGPLVEQELPTLPEHLSSPFVFRWVRVTLSLVLYVCFVDHCVSFCPVSFGHCVVCSSIYGFWLLLWHIPLKIINIDPCSLFY